MRTVWRRRARRRLLAFNAAFALVVVLPITLYGAHHVHWRWFAGVVAGGWLSTLIGLREFPPGHIERWQEGAWGEEWTAKELRPLSHEGWTVLHDRRDGPNGRANLDHVLVGPGGVFLLDSKRWHGVTTVEDGVPTLRRHEDPDLPGSLFESLPRKARGAAVRLSGTLMAETRVKAWVQPVVVIWGEFPERVVERDGVAYIHGDEVRRWLRERPVRLQPEQAGRLGARLTVALVSA